MRVSSKNFTVGRVELSKQSETKNDFSCSEINLQVRKTIYNLVLL